MNTLTILKDGATVNVVKITIDGSAAGGEIFVLKTSTGAFVLVRIDAVNITTDDNADSYTIRAKF